jgi:hypothetical protein
MKRLRTLGIMKAYLEFYNNLPELFKYSTQFQVVPLGLCTDLQHHSTSMYMQSTNNNACSSNKSGSNNASNYSSYYAAGFGTGWSDLDSDFKLSALKNQAFSVFALSKRFLMSPSHNYYLNSYQHQSNSSMRPKTLTGFGPAASEEKFLRESFLNALGSGVKHFMPL